MRLKEEQGFTLVEVIVVAAIIAILAGILVPMIFSQIDEAKLSRARGDVRSISTGIYAFRKDVGQWPACNNTTMLFGSGVNAPPALTALGYDASVIQLITDHLLIDDNACYGDLWKGPYFGSVDADPWGNAYFINALGFGAAGTPVYVLSAGPDGAFQTVPTATEPLGDDIGIRIK